MKKKVTIGVAIFAIVLLLVNVVIFFDSDLSDKNKIDISEKDEESDVDEEIKKTVKESELKTNVDKNYKINSNIQASAYDGVYKRLFNTEEIIKVNINMYDKNYTYLIENALDKPYVFADSISIGDTTIGSVGMKTKGEETLIKAKLNKYSFTIHTNKYIKKQLGVTQNLYGLEKISLNSMNQDTAFLKEYLSYYLMSELGLCTPYYSIVNLYINNKNKGLYLLLENIEDSLIKRCYGETGNFLTKPEEVGGDLVYIDELDNYIDENGNYKFDIDNYEDKNNILQKYSGILEEKASGIEITDENVDKEELSKEIDMFFKWLKKINQLSNTKDKNTLEFEREVESIMDIEQVIKYFAALVFLSSDDSYIGLIPHNYGLYINENMKMNIIPWDFNLSFGNFLLTATEMINHRIDNPGFSTKTEDRPLLNIVMGNKKYREKYYYYLDVCTKIAMGGDALGKTYEKNNYINIINKVDKKLIDIIDTSVDYYSIEEHNKGIRTLKNLIRLRTKAVSRQLDGNFEKIKTDINILDLGRIL